MLHIKTTCSLALLSGAAALSACKDQSEKIAPDPAGIDATVVVDINTPCPAGLPGPTMVRVPTPGGVTYCIDSTEASQGDYFKFLYEMLEDPTLNGKPKVDGGGWAIGPGCEWNTALELGWAGASNICTQTPEAFSQYNEFPNNPIACVDWCDAYAYCAWAGKRLCGRIGGGAAKPSEVANENASEWFNVCSQGGKTKYSYGDTYSADQMDPSEIPTAGLDAGKGSGAIAVDKPTQCRGTLPPFDKISQVGCNVAEWQDACGFVESKYKSCAVNLIGDYSDPPEKRALCTSASLFDPGSTYVNVGFRCCHD